MHIGIITYHRAHNYGAVLQCYALQQVLINMGHKVEVVDYVNPYIDWLYKPHKAIIYVIKQLLQFNFYRIKQHIESYKLAKKRSFFFGNFVKKYLNCSSKCDEKTIPQNCDAYIIGSDQMWSLDCSGGQILCIGEHLVDHVNLSCMGFQLVQMVTSKRYCRIEMF